MTAFQRTDRNQEWWVDFRWKGRRIRAKAALQTKRGPEQHERQLRHQFSEDEDHGVDPFAGPPPKFADFAERWMKDYVLPTNRVGVHRDKPAALQMHLVPAFGKCRLDEITTARIDAFAAEKTETGLRPKTINNLLSMLRCALTTAQEWGLLASVPRVRWRRVPSQGYRYLTAEEMVRLIDAASHGYWKPFIIFLLYTGCRFGEAAALRWEDVNALTATKTGHEPTVPLSPKVVAALRAFLRSSEYVFLYPNTATFPRPDSTGKVLDRFCREAGIKRISWKDLRHTCATQLTSRGSPIGMVQKLLGTQPSR